MCVRVGVGVDVGCMPVLGVGEDNMTQLWDSVVLAWMWVCWREVCRREVCVRESMCLSSMSAIYEHRSCLTPHLNHGA